MTDCLSSVLRLMGFDVKDNKAGSTELGGTLYADNSVIIFKAREVRLLQETFEDRH